MSLLQKLFNPDDPSESVTRFLIGSLTPRLGALILNGSSYASGAILNLDVLEDSTGRWL